MIQFTIAYNSSPLNSRRLSFMIARYFYQVGFSSGLSSLITDSFEVLLVLKQIPSDLPANFKVVAFENGPLRSQFTLDSAQSCRKLQEALLGVVIF